MPSDDDVGEHRQATAEEIREWNEENDEPHPVFAVPHQPERLTFEHSCDTPAGYRADEPTHGGYGMPRGPLGTHDVGPLAPVAIGFCPWCGANARGTCSNRGVFDCPRCTFYWYDERVGQQTRSFEDFFSNV